MSVRDSRRCSFVLSVLQRESFAESSLAVGVGKLDSIPYINQVFLKEQIRPVTHTINNARKQPNPRDVKMPTRLHRHFQSRMWYLFSRRILRNGRHGDDRAVASCNVEVLSREVFS
jgi:hypothetical protein